MLIGKIAGIATVVMLVDSHHEQKVVYFLKPLQVILFVIGQYILRYQKAHRVQYRVKLIFKSDIVFTVNIFNVVEVEINAFKFKPRQLRCNVVYKLAAKFFIADNTLHILRVVTAAHAVVVNVIGKRYQYRFMISPVKFYKAGVDIGHHRIPAGGYKKAFANHHIQFGYMIGERKIRLRLPGPVKAGIYAVLIVWTL